MTRRSLLASAAAASMPAWAADLPVIDTHIHLFDPGRPQGVPWPPKGSKIYKAALPDRYRALVKPFNVKGAVMVECSPWFDDNQWVLDVIQKDPIMVGMIGNLEPDHAEFPKQLERFRKNPLYLGIRYGNLWDRDFHGKLANPKFIAGVKMLADAGMTMDSANPDPKLIVDLLRLTERVPNLRLVVDHLPKLEVPTEPTARKAYEKDLTELAKRPLSYSKVSAVLRMVNGKVPTDVAFYKDRLDFLFGAFGEDRVVYGSDWPNSDFTAEYPAVIKVVSDYFATKTPAQREKYFWRNSVAAYRWKKRDGSQPG